MKKTNIAGLFILGACALGMSQASAATISVTNFSFEDPGTGKTSDLTAVTGWDLEAGTAGVEPLGSPGHYAPSVTDGSYNLYAGTDSWAIQTTVTPIATGDQFTLTVDASNTWNSIDGATIELYYDDGGTLISLGTTTLGFSGAQSGPFEMTLNVSADDTPASYGNNIGIRLGTTDAWVGFDNVRLDVVPEPSSTALLGTLLAFGLIRRRK